MSSPDSIEKAPDGEIVSFRTKVHGEKVFRKWYPQPDGTKRLSSTWVVKKSVSRDSRAFVLGKDMKTAEKLADEISAYLSIPSHTMAMAMAKYNPRHENRGIATIGDCLTTFEAALGIIGRRGASVNPGTFKGYRSMLLKLVRRALAYRKGEEWVPFTGQHHIDFSPWLKQSTEILTARLIQDYKLGAVPHPDDADEEEIQSARISVDSTLLNARAIFSKRAIDYFQQVGMKLPDLTGFLKEPGFNAKKYFELLDPEVIVAVHRASFALQASNLDAYRVFLLCMHCGLRAGEAAAFRPEWLRRDDKPMLLVRVKGEFNPKHGRGRKVVLEPWVYAALDELGPVREAKSFDELTAWTRALIPQGTKIQKPLHELRKCWVSAKAKMDGILAACQQAGHGDPKVTTTHYADNLLADRLVPFWQKPPAELLKLG